jgi:hypothetical protein
MLTCGIPRIIGFERLVGKAIEAVRVAAIAVEKRLRTSGALNL